MHLSSFLNIENKNPFDSATLLLFTGLFLALLGIWPVALELGFSRSIAQNLEFFSKVLH